MSIESQIEREENFLDEQLSSGYISNSEYTTAINDIQRDYQAAAEEASQDAYDNEMDNW